MFTFIQNYNVYVNVALERRTIYSKAILKLFLNNK